MDVKAIVDQLENLQAQLLIRGTNGGVEIAPPHIIGPVIVKMRVLLVQMVDKVYDIELDYRKSKSSMVDKLLKEGLKPSPALDRTEMDPDIIEKKISVERLKNYMKYIDGLVSSVQSNIKIQTGMDNGSL